MSKHKIPRSFGTHDGTFHADEVTACAILLLFDYIDEDKIRRTRDHAVLETCDFVCDVGGIYDPKRRLFDHHQVNYQGSLSSAGMILQYLRDIDRLSQQEYEFFNHSLVMGVDAHDNGKDLQIPGICTYSHIIASFTPIKQDVDNATLDKAFHTALDFSKNYLKRIWEKHLFNHSCLQIVAAAMKQGGDCLMFDQNIPWIESFFELDGVHHPATFVIMPSDNHWKLRGIPPSYEQRMKVRVPLPEEWAGLLDEEIKRVTGIPGAIFCHKGRFISVWETKEDALKALQLVKAMQKNKVNSSPSAKNHTPNHLVEK